ncbi:MAG: DUF599 domain-containing protein [Hyphomicrobiaceae bacterium]
MLPQDFGLLNLIAVTLIFACWFGYSLVLARFGRGSLNSQLAVIRRHWMSAATRRAAKPFDAVLLGHIINSIAFFGSGTLIVLAGLISTFANVKSIHATISELHFIVPTSLELFALHVGLLAMVLAISFFSFTYALRKLIYTIALIGALPDSAEEYAEHDALVTSASLVLSEAIKTYNFGIRGYYYAIASLCLVASPYASMAATALVTAILFYRQLASPTANAIQNYVAAAKLLNK